MITIQDQIDSLRESLKAQSIGLENVYNQFQKYELSKIDEKIEDLLKKIKRYELQENVEEFDIDVRTYPMNIRINLRVKTNFGSCIYSFDYPPAMEYQLAHVVQAAYVSMLESLYEKHDKRGGKYPINDTGSKKWLDENGETFLDLNEKRISS